jgi:hypothetical protein
MYGDVQTDFESTLFPRRVGAWVGAEGSGQARASREPVVRAASLKAAIVQLRNMAEANAGRSSRQALLGNLMVLRRLGVDEEALDLVVEMVLAQDVDEEMTAAINYLASGFLLALLTFREEGAFGAFVTPEVRESEAEAALAASSGALGGAPATRRRGRDEGCQP